MATAVKISLEHKVVPDDIRDEIVYCLNNYPNLEQVFVEFKFRKRFKKSFMLAQPIVSTLFRNRKRRGYRIIMSRKFKLEGEKVLGIHDLPKDVLIGWLAHELGHIVDYGTRSSFQMVMFGIKYLLFGWFVKKAERSADVCAIEAGFGDYIALTKEYIVTHADLSETYKDKIKRLYLGPEEIMKIANSRNPKLRLRLHGK